MLYQTFKSDDGASFNHLHVRALFAGSPVVDLLANARATLDHDPSTAHRYLDQLAAIFEKPAHDAETDHAFDAPRSVGIGPGPIKGGLAPWQLRKVVSHINDHLSGPVMVEVLATITRLSSGHFCRAFKTSTGETPHTYLVRQRIRRAQSLMLTTNETLSQIACACGLTDQAHLTRLFRKFVGETPLVWRRERQNA